MLFDLSAVSLLFSVQEPVCVACCALKSHLKSQSKPVLGALRNAGCAFAVPLWNLT